MIDSVNSAQSTSSLTSTPYPLWSGGELPKTADIPMLDGVEFSVIQPYQPEVDGGNWVLGVALAWHKNRLYASYGFNRDPHENTATEQAHCRISDDAGKTWGDVVVIDNPEGNLAVSHGVFLSRDDKLWAFQGAFYDNFQRTHTRAYLLDDATGNWQHQGIVVDDGFWPLQEPLKMADGNWIMSGIRVSNGYEGVEGDLPAVAISHGDDLTRWDLVVIPVAPEEGRVWGESAVIPDGTRLLNISHPRWGTDTHAMVAFSEDCGRTWTTSASSNLPMVDSKPYAGTLSTGQRYLIGTTTADSSQRPDGLSRRSPLTIAISRPGDESFSRLFVIRDAMTQGDSIPAAPGYDLSYPYAVEYGGKLYVGYSIKKQPTNVLAVIPLSELTE
jgi:hypothetical protein